MTKLPLLQYVSLELERLKSWRYLFFYDINGLWNNYIKSDFRIILINNSGRGIFRILPGLENNEIFSKFIETKHDLKAKKIAQLYVSIIGLPILLYYDQKLTGFSLISILLFEFGLICVYTASTLYHYVSDPELKQKLRIFGEELIVKNCICPKCSY